MLPIQCLGIFLTPDFFRRSASNRSIVSVYFQSVLRSIRLKRPVSLIPNLFAAQRLFLALLATINRRTDDIETEVQLRHTTKVKTSWCGITKCDILYTLHCMRMLVQLWSVCALAWT